MALDPLYTELVVNLIKRPELRGANLVTYGEMLAFLVRRRGR